MVTTLSCFYFFNNNRQPNTSQRNEIRKWFWHTGIASRYSGRGYRKNILADVALFNKMAKNTSQKYSVNEPVPYSELLNSDYSKNTSLGSAYFLLLKRNKPKYLENGEPIILSNYSTIANRSNKAHIFPQEFLKRNDVIRTKVNCIINICLLAAQENQKIGGTSPPIKYLELNRKKQFFASVMKSHFIPFSSNSSLWAKNKSGYYKFLEEKSKIIVNAFEQEAGVKIFAKL